jgi:hypothetical protein
MTEIDLNHDMIQQIVDKAHEFHAGTDVVFPDEEEVTPDQWAEQMSTSFGTDPFYQEFKTMIEDLEPDQQVSLVSLMWVGRGDFTVDEWPDALKFAEETWTDHTADYLIGTALLADYLQGGLDQLESTD